MIELVVAVCLSAQPDTCERKIFTFYEGTSLFGCMVQAQPYLAAWENENPEWTIRKWKCGFPTQRERDA